MSSQAITTLFLDVGGVLLTNGWDRKLRQRAAEHFNLELSEMDERHRLTFDTYEVGKMTLEEYLNRVVFYQKRSFSIDQFTNYILTQAKPFSEMIELVRTLKTRCRLKVAVVSNEGRELIVDRIQRFKLDEFVDFFIASSFVHFRKPDKDIFRIALDIAQVSPSQVAYIEDRAMFVEVANSLGIRGIHHASIESTRRTLEKFGLTRLL